MHGFGSGVGHYGGQRSGLGLAPQGMKPASGQAHGSPARVAYAPGQHGTPGPPAAQTAQGNMTPQGAMQLDETVARNKNLRDSMIVENWIRKSQQIMQKFKLDPLPDFPAMDGTHSDTGTDFSAALTMEAHDQHASKTPEVSPPVSPPWRIKNEGGVPAEMPDLPMQEIQQHLAAFQEQQRAEQAEQEARRAHQEELERKHKEQLQKQADEKRRHHQMMKEQYQKQEEARRQQAKTPHKSSADRPKEEDPRLPGHSNAPGIANDTGPSSPAPAPASKQITLGLSFAKCEEGGMKVARIKDAGCAALHGGIQVGDRVLRIDGEELADKSAIQLNKLQSGAENSQAVLEVIKAGATDTVTMVIKRELASSKKSGFGVVQRT